MIRDTVKKDQEAEIPSALRGGEEEKYEVRETCIGVSLIEQAGIEIELSNGVLFVVPYSNHIAARHETIDKTEHVEFMVGALTFCLEGRGLRRALEAIRRHRLAYLRPMPANLAKAAPSSVLVITKASARKQTKQDPRPDLIGSAPAEPEVPDDGSAVEMDESGAIKPVAGESE